MTDSSYSTGPGPARVQSYTMPHGEPMPGYRVYKFGVIPVPSCSAMILLLSLLNTHFMNQHPNILATENAIISAIALTYRGSSAGSKK